MQIRFGTLQQNRLLTGFALKTQGRVYEAQAQVASGQRSQDYAGLSPRANRLVTLENRLAKTEQFLENIDIAQQRIKLMEQSLTQITDLARNFRSELTNIVNGDGAFTVSIWDQAQNLMVQLGELLNQRDAGRYLFGGSRGDERPVDIAPGNFTGVPAGAIAAPHPNNGVITIALINYYQGSTESAEQSVRVDEFTTVAYGIKANEDAIRELLIGIDIMRDTVIAAPPVTAADRSRIDEAIARLTYALEGSDPDGGGPLTAIESLEQLGTRVASANVALEEVKTKQQQFTIYAGDVISDIENVEPADAVARLNSDQVALQASFEALARMQGLSLTNFLR